MGAPLVPPEILPKVRRFGGISISPNEREGK
jgi:hypothetical protein